MMKRTYAALMSAFALATFATATVEAQTGSCPPELAKAKAMISQQAKGQDVQAPRSLAGARQDPAKAGRAQEVQAPRGQDVQAPRGQEVQAPRSLAGAREIQAPRGQEVQAPRGQEVQAPRGQEVQAPRGQEVQAPRGQEVQAPRSQAGSKVTGSKAWSLVQEAEAACKKGDMSTAKAKAEAAMAEIK